MTHCLLKKIFDMGAGREEVKIELKAFDKKEKSSTKKALLVTMEPRDRYLYAVKCIYFGDRNRGLDKFIVKLLTMASVMQR